MLLKYRHECVLLHKTLYKEHHWSKKGSHTSGLSAGNKRWKLDFFQRHFTKNESNSIWSLENSIGIWEQDQQQCYLHSETWWFCDREAIHHQRAVSEHWASDRGKSNFLQVNRMIKLEKKAFSVELQKMPVKSDHASDDRNIYFFIVVKEIFGDGI